MDFSLLKSYIAVSEEKSFSTAAKHLFISQQTLSKQIAKLEEELGTTLLIRSRPLMLTPDGQQFLKVAREIMQLKQQFEESSSKSINKAHHIHVGIEHTIARALLPHVLPDYINAHPDTFVKVSEATPDVLQKAIAYEGVDLVIGSIASVPDTYEVIPLCPKHQLLVVPKTIFKMLAGGRCRELIDKFNKEGADLTFFRDAPFIKISRQSSGGRTLSNYLKYYDMSVHFVCELTNVENAFQLANSGLGLFIYSRIFWDMASEEMRKDYLSNVYIFRLPFLPDTDPVCAYYSKESGLHGDNLTLLEEIRKFFEKYQLEGCCNGKKH